MMMLLPAMHQRCRAYSALRLFVVTNTDLFLETSSLRVTNIYPLFKYCNLQTSQHIFSSIFLQLLRFAEFPNLSQS